jgi:transmembrane sensor
MIILEQFEHIKYLYQKYLNNTISDIERKQLMRFFQTATDAEMEAVIGKLTEDNIPTNDLSTFDERVELIFSRITEHTQPEPKKQKLRKWLPYAAAVVVLLGVSLFFGRQHTDNPTPTQTVQVLKDLAPGGKRATLTFADGKKILLDSAHSGQIAELDGIRISKTVDGQLVYEINAEGTQTQTNRINIPRGGEYQLLLPDGTKVRLNASTTLEYPTRFTGKERSVKLTGEAYFEVAKDVKHPFIVETYQQKIQVLGTHFNVNTYQNERTITTLEEGSVKVSGSGDAKVLKPGQQSILFNGSLIVSNADMESALAWKNGLMLFKQTPLKTVLEEISRWYDVDVVYNGTPPVKTLSGGINRSWNLSATLRILTLTGVKTKLISEGNSRKLIIEP